MFPTRLKYGNLQYASNILSYIKSTPEFEFRSIGDKTLEHLQQFRSVKETYIPRYYELLSGIIRLLKRYADLEESCVSSGAYNNERLATLKQLYDKLQDFEKQKDVMSLLDGMRKAQL